MSGDVRFTYCRRSGPRRRAFGITPSRVASSARSARSLKSITWHGRYQPAADDCRVMGSAVWSLYVVNWRLSGCLLFAFFSA